MTPDIVFDSANRKKKHKGQAKKPQVWRPRARLYSHQPRSWKQSRCRAAARVPKRIDTAHAELSHRSHRHTPRQPGDAALHRAGLRLGTAGLLDSQFTAEEHPETNITSQL